MGKRFLWCYEHIRYVQYTVYSSCFISLFYYRMSISDRCETEKISSLVEHHVPKAKLSQKHEAELTFTLPFESMDTFPGKNLTVFMREGEREEWQSLSLDLSEV